MPWVEDISMMAKKDNMLAVVADGNHRATATEQICMSRVKHLMGTMKAVSGKGTGQANTEAALLN
jgi:uncharacterized protein (DUF1015 family)